MSQITSRPLPALSHRVRLALLELALVLGVYLLYRAGRVAVLGNEAVATANARAVHELQRVLGLPSEAALQARVPSVDLLELANVYYVGMHFPAIVTFLLWGYFRRTRAEYLWARNLLLVQTTLAVILHVVFPLAPPRMFAQWGFVDTMTVYGPSAYDGASAAVANQYAAMPSLHVGWAVLIAVVVCRCGPVWAKVLVGCHALLTVVVVTVTANHWLLDGIVAVALLGLALVVFPAPGRRRSLRSTSGTGSVPPAGP